MAADELDAVVIGAGLAGLHQLHRLREQGLRVRALDAAGGVGGAWWWHDFPGARLDVDGHLHRYLFSERLYRDWGWSERFPGGYEVLRWLRFVADRLDLERDVRTSSRVEALHWDETRGRWSVRTAGGEGIEARFVVSCAGTLAAPGELAGGEAFAGPVLRTSAWPRRAPDLTSSRVGVVARGASAVQLVPTLADRVAHLVVFVHGPHDVLPRQNPMYGWRERERDAARFAELAATLPDTVDGFEPDTDRGRDELHADGSLALWRALARRGSTADDAAFVRDRMRERLDGDPRLVEALVPAGDLHRVLPDSGWLEAFRRDDVTLVDARHHPVARACPEGVVLDDGTVHELDAVVVAGELDTGVDALADVDVRGRGGRVRSGDATPATLGVAVHGYPNLFVTAAGPPGTAPVNPAVAREQQSDWIARAIGDLLASGATVIEPRTPGDGRPEHDLGALRRRREQEAAAGYPCFARERFLVP